jgi:hypothetical protein
MKYMSVCPNYLFSYAACKSRVLCVILSPVACLAVSSFSTLSMNYTIFGGVIERKMSVLIFCTNFSEISQNSARWRNFA